MTISRPHVRISRFGAALAIVALFGLAIRLVYVFAAPITVISGDGGYFHLGANYLADGKGFLDPIAYVFSLGTVRVPGAEHPPAWTVVLDDPVRIAVSDAHGPRGIRGLSGTATISSWGSPAARWPAPRGPRRRSTWVRCTPASGCMSGSCSRRPGDLRGCARDTARVAIPSAANVAPRRLAVGRGLWSPRTHAHSKWPCSRFLLLVPLMLLPPVSWQRRVGWLAVAKLRGGDRHRRAWIVDTTASRFDHQVLISTQGGRTLAASNCDRAYYGPLLGYKSLATTSLQQTFAGDRRRVSAGHGAAGPSVGRDAAGSRSCDSSRRNTSAPHRGRLPVVAAAREGRTWGVFRPFQQLRLDLIEDDIRFLWAEYFFYLAMLPAAIAGASSCTADEHHSGRCLAPIVTVAITVVTTFGSTRYRAPADVAIALLAAATIGVVLDRALAARRRAAPRAADTEVRVPQPAAAT